MLLRVNAPRAKQSGGILKMWERKKSKVLQISTSQMCVICSVDLSIVSWLKQRTIGDNIGAVSKNQIVRA